jgi:putative membrane protein
MLFNNFKNLIKMKKISIFSVLTMMVAMLIPASYGQNSQTPKLTDPEIASVAVTANQIDINNGRLAKEKSKNSDILKFADMMIMDHQSVIDQATALVKKLGVTPKDNDVSKNLNSQAESTMNTLKAKSGIDFDKAYIDNEVAVHKAVIETLQNVLIPQTQNAELKALLNKVLPIVKTHLQAAETVQKKVSK